MKIKNNQVLYWEENDAILGFCQVVQGKIKENFGGGFAMQDKEGKPSKSGFAKNRAIRQVKTQFVNVFNALILYGDKILDKDGNIDPKKFLEYEKSLVRSYAKGKKVNDKLLALKDLDTKKITLKQATSLKLSEK